MIKKADAKLTREESTNKRVELILMTAVECFAEKGFHQTSIRDIASKAGISLGNLYNHFASKDALISAIANLETIEQKGIESILSKEGDPLMIIEKFVSAYLKQMADPTNAALTYEIASETMRNPYIASGFIDNRKQIRSKISQVLELGMKRGQVDPQLDLIEIAEIIIDMIEGLALRAVFEHRKVSNKSKVVLQSMIQKMLIP